MKRNRVLAAKTALATGAVALGLAGCSVTSPATIKTPYPASDGIDAELPGTDVALRNLIVVGAEKGAEAELIGSAVNTGTRDAQVQLQAAVGASGQPSQTTVPVPAGETVQFGPGSTQTAVSISDLAVEPGDVTGLTASTTSGGRVDLTVPVLPPEGDYAGVTPASSPTGKATPSETATGDTDTGMGESEGETPSPSTTATDGTGMGESEGETATATPQSTNNRKKQKQEDETPATGETSASAN